jgi:hypothetical protein
MGEADFRFNGHVIEYLARDESAVVVFVGMTIHSHEGMFSCLGLPILLYA